MKLTKDGQTLFTALCTFFTDKAGHQLSRRVFGDYTSLVATRNEEKTIQTIHIQFKKTNIMTLSRLDNNVFIDVTAWFTQSTMNRLNKALGLVGLKICKQNDVWVIEDAQGQKAPFQNVKAINLSRPHGSALYEQA